MGIQKSFSCFVIGSDALLVECAEILLRQGHQVRGVISSAPRVVAWARERGLSIVGAESGYVEVLRREPFEYLFSITHLEIIPDEALALPSRGAINFHDGPLPRYAGLNAPAWAILAGETHYGITWHRLGPKIDAGDILKQVSFDVQAGETSLSLNTKCFAHAIETFAELVNELSSETTSATPQDLAGRSYFGRFRRPEAACVVDWTCSATSIESLVRALDFGGRYPNTLGLAKVHAGANSFAITRAEAEPGGDGSPPGTITFVRADAMGVATGDGILAIRGASSLGGEVVDPSKLAEKHGWAPGHRFEEVTPVDRERLTALDKSVCRAEPFWVDRLRSFEPFEVPFAAARRDESREEHAEFPLELRGWRADGTGRDGGFVDTLAAVLALLCARLVPRDSGSLGFVTGALVRELGGAAVLFAETVPLSIGIEWGVSFQAHRDRVASELREIASHRTYLRDMVARYPELRQNQRFADGSALPVCLSVDADPPAHHKLAVVVPPQGAPRISYDTHALSADDARAFARHLVTLFESALRTPDASLGSLALLTDEERARVVVEFNRTERTYAPDCVHRLFEAQASRTPNQAALVFEGATLSYRELDERSNRLAAHLQSLGVRENVLVGIHLERSLDLVVSVLATLKAGGAYVPLDPTYPEARLAFMMQDAKLAVIVTNEEGASSLHPGDVAVVRLDTDAEPIARGPTTPPTSACVPESLAYVIYTSGSTGKPKGVMVEHRNVVNFFGAMDERLGGDPPGTWLAVTSLSFDISVLELLWPLTRGFQVVIHRDRKRESAPLRRRGVRASMDFSLFYFASDESLESGDKYELLLEGAKFADAHEFTAVWTPERHFHAFGGLYPNPAVIGAALAVLTKNVQIRAGSVVLPLHHPARVAEAWSVVDNLSRGRVGISFASGWQPNDFVLRPESFKDSKAVMFRDLEVVKALWRGESAAFPGPKGDMVSVRTLPRPVQKELPIWITTAGNIDTYKAAGRIGANILTHLLGQSVSELGPKIRAYREARREHGHDPNAGVVSIMLHTFVGDDDAEVREIVREPLKQYLGSSLELLKHYAWAFPAFSRPKDVANDAGDDLARLTEEERDALLEHAYLRYYETSGLFGRPEDCLRRIDELAEIGVNEVACLIDFGVPTSRALEHLVHLDRLRSMVADGRNDAGEADSIGALIRRHQVTHLQCTPSMARMLLDDPGDRAALRELASWLVGGEALSLDLVREMRSATSAALFNMYGPTETTVWSTMHAMGDGDARVSIGRPIANTRVYLLDPRGEPVPIGASGEVYIGGAGVARGYLGRDELTAERFVRDPFSSGRMYRTGDLARFRSDGSLEFIGRADQQIKIRGHRVELGEIESAIVSEPGVKECAVVLREDTPGDQRLVAYVAGQVDVAALGDALCKRMPDFMVPAHVVLLAELPQTPNRKLDRRALPAPETTDVVRRADYVAPQNDIERTIADLWQEILGRDRIGTEDNFFDVGGHSLLVVRMHRRLRELIAQPITLTDLYRFPTIRSLTDFLTRGGAAPGAQDGAARAERRREMNERRRRSSNV